MLHSFRNFLAQQSKFVFQVAKWVIAINSTSLGKGVFDIKSKHFWDFLETANQLTAKTANFRDFLAQASKFGFCVVAWVLAIKSRDFRDLLETS